MNATDYLNPNVPAGLNRVVMPVVDATPESLVGYGNLFDDPESQPIEIVRWPAQGWRPVDTDSGDEGGTTEGIFISQWQGDILYGRNEAVDGHYILAYGVEPGEADTSHHRPPAANDALACELPSRRRPDVLSAGAEAVLRPAGAAGR